MRISISGAPGLGKQRLCDIFTQQWPTYKAVKAWKYDVDNESVEKTQINRAQAQLKEIEKYTKFDDKVVYVTCPLDGLLHSIRLNEAKVVSDDHVKEMFEISQKALSYIDAVFVLPVSKLNPIYDLNEDVNEMNDLGTLWNIINHSYSYGEQCPFINLNDCPGIIEVFGDENQKLELMKLYLDDKGDLIEGNMGKLLADQQEATAAINQILQDQKEQKEIEDFQKQLKQNTNE